MKLLITLLLLWATAAQAQFTQPTSCGPDVAPAQAAAAGFTCETFRWGSGDTLSEIDTTNSNAPFLYKFYEQPGGGVYPTDYNVTGGNLVILQSFSSTGFPMSLSTCGNNATVGYSFTGGFYWEVALTYTATGNMFSGKPGSYGLAVERYEGITPNVELDSVDGDGYGYGIAFVYWTGPGGGTTPNVRSNSGTTNQYLGTTETGNLWGVLSTPTVVSWWYNNTPNGTVNLVAGDAALLYGEHQCLGLMGTDQYPMTVNSFKVWQAIPTPAGGVGRRSR